MISSAADNDNSIRWTPQDLTDVDIGSSNGLVPSGTKPLLNFDLDLSHRMASLGHSVLKLNQIYLPCLSASEPEDFLLEVAGMIWNNKILINHILTLFGSILDMLNLN